MRRRIPLAVSVVGALLVGGATTGTTYARWTDNAAVTASSVTAGRMSFTAGTPATVTMGTSSTTTTSITLDDTSLGKNLRQRLTVAVTSAPAGVSATIGTSCPGAASASVITTPGTSSTLCIRLATTSTASSGLVTLTASGAQQPSGWSTPVTTRQFTVTVTPPATPPSAPANFRCYANSKNDLEVRWDSVAAASSYRVYARLGTTGAFTQPVTVTAPTTQLGHHRNTAPWAFGNDDLITVVVRSVSAAGVESANSTVVTKQFGKDNTCTP